MSSLQIQPATGTTGPDLSWVIRRPAGGRYQPDVLGLEERPVGEPGPEEVRVRTLYLSLDPSNLVSLRLQPGWIEDFTVGDVFRGRALAVVEASGSSAFAVGDLVSGSLPWSTRSIVRASALAPLDSLDSVPLATHLTLFSHVGHAASIGITEVGQVRPGEVVLVSGSAGATGRLAAEIALAGGARVVGIAGGKAKVAALRSETGVHGTIDYKSENLDEALARECPDGVDVYFDNVGGEMLDTVLPHMRVHGRVAICGAMSTYADPDARSIYRYANLFRTLMLRLRIEGFVAADYEHRYGELNARLAVLYRDGKITHRPHVLDGIGTAATGLELLLNGANDGKLMVRVSDEPAAD